MGSDRSKDTVFFPCMLPTPLCGIFLIYKGKKTIQVFHKNFSGGGSEALLILLIQNGWRFMAKNVYVILELFPKSWSTSYLQLLGEWSGNSVESVSL